MLKPIMVVIAFAGWLCIKAFGDVRFVEFEGKITAAAKSGCEKGSAQLFIADAASGTLVYQVDVIPNGSFEFKLKPGKYQVRAASSAGCEGLYILDATDGIKVTRQLELTKKKAKKS